MTKAERKKIALRNLKKAHAARKGHKARRSQGRSLAMGTLRGTYNAAKARYKQAGEALYRAGHGGHSIKERKRRKRKKTGHRKSR